MPTFSSRKRLGIPHVRGLGKTLLCWVPPRLRFNCSLSVFNDPLPKPLRNLVVFFRPLEPLREEVLVELEAVLVHRVNVAQARDDKVDDRAARRDDPAVAVAAAVAAALYEQQHVAVAAAVAVRATILRWRSLC